MTSPSLGGAHDRPQPTESRLWTARAARWFLDSGIQADHGGVSRYYRMDLGEYWPVSTEITGYAASALLLLHALTGDARCLDAAVRAGRFLARSCWDPRLGTIPYECGAPGGGRAYFFDLGIMARGLLALWRATGDSEFLECAAGCARSMAEDFRSASGYHPVILLPSKRPIEGGGGWSVRPGCYQLKAAMAWLEVGEAAGSGRFTPLYEELRAAMLAGHASFLEDGEDRHETVDRLHAYCYFLEGLLPRAGQDDCRVVLRDGILRVARLAAGIGPEFERSDVVAQLLRLRLYAAALGVSPLDREAAASEALRLGGHQIKDGGMRAEGAFCFGRRGHSPAPYANPVSTAFAVQALAMWDAWRHGTFQPDVWSLI